MLIPARFQQHCAQLTNPKITPEARRDLAGEVRDSIELVHSQEYASFLHNFLPAFKVVLSDLTSPQQVDNTIHKTRAIILEVLNRLPHNNVLREKILDVFNMAMDTLKNDNEDNAVTALHIIFDLHKNDRHHLGGQVQPFLDFVRRLYESFGKTVEMLLMATSPAPTAGTPKTPKISPSTQSFKVITECPLLVMFVFQLYPNLIQANIQRLLPLMVRAMQYTVPVQMIPAASKQVFQEFIASQVKTVSFLAYLLKQFPDVMKADELSIPRSVVKLMQTCPGDSVAIRKELLVATRHILTSRFRRGFFDQIDLLLDERVLVGTGRAGTGTLRPLAYSFLAELVHCVRLNLSIPQLEKIIFLFSANVHDPKFSYTLQTNSVRLLLNLIEGILKVDPADATQRPAARELLIRILETLVTKYVTLGEQVPRLLDSVVSLRREPDPIAMGKRLGEVPLGDPLKEIADFKTLLKTLTLGLKTVIWSAINIRVPHTNKSKSTPPVSLAANAQHRKSATPTRQSIRTGLLEKECEIVSRLLSAGRKCFQLYSRHEKANGATGEPLRPQLSDESQDRKERVLGEKHDATFASVTDMLSEYAQTADPARIVAASPQEEREVFDQFAQIFTVLDPPSFQDVFGLRIADLFDYIVENGTAITIPQHFLANSSVSKYFADIMFNFLIENMCYLDVSFEEASQKHSNQGKRANCLLKLFKILFASVSLFPTNEPVLRLHLQSIVKNCLKHASRAKDPHAYLQMLRALFKSITSGKHEVQFDTLYRDFMPLVEPIFAHLLALYAGPSRLPHRELIIELCLMVPARPSTIFPYLEQQIKPIVWALEGSRENPMYGLRTLEFWVDMLQPGYLRLLLAKVEPDLTRALHRHLRPPGNTFGPGALRILGKLGARSRSHKSLTLPFALKEKAESAQRLSVEWQDGVQLNLETDELINLSADALLDRRDRELVKCTKEYKKQAWSFLFGCLCPFIGFQEDPNTVQRLSSAERIERKMYLSRDNATGQSRESHVPVGCIKEITSSETATARLVSTIMSSLIASAKGPDLKDACIVFTSSDNGKGTPEKAMRAVCKYFALLSVQELVQVGEDTSLLSAGQEKSIRGTSESQLSSTLFVDALIEATSLESRLHANSGLECLQLYVTEVIGYCVASNSSPITEEQETAEARLPADTDDPSSTRQQDLQTDDTMVRTNGEVKCNRTEDQKTSSALQRPDAMDVDVPDTRQNAEKGDCCQNSVFPDGIVATRVLAPLLDRLCHSCYKRTWNARWAGVHGLEALISSLPSSLLSSQTQRAVLMRCFTALLFLARDTADFGNDGTVSLAVRVLQKVIHGLFQPTESQTVTGTQSGFPHDAYKILASDLMSGSSNARETAQVCFREIAKALGQEEVDVVIVVRNRILKPLQERPLRQHALKTQIGYLDAVNFCLQLGKQIICADLFLPPLKEYVLMESMHIMDANNLDPFQDGDDGFRAKYHENKYLDGKTTRLLLLLRRKVLDFLCNVSVHCSSSLQEAQHERIFRLMISCFFRSLQARDEDMVQSAKRGLKHAISKHPKPKELLQHNLRPLLGNLGDYKKLTIQYLQGLNRVLELFSHWFNVNLGEKLLEHLQRWTEPEKIAPLKKMMAGAESRVAAAILDLFHLLPAAASKFMEQIVKMVLRLESVIALAAPGAAHLGLKNAMGASTSPYRAPLLKYSNQHAAVASKYFLAHLDDERIRQLFFVMIRSTELVALRNDLMQTPKRLLSASHFSYDDNTGKSLHVITLIDLLSRHEPTWLKADPEIVLKLSTYWKMLLTASELRQNDSQSLSRVRVVKMIAEIFIRYCTQFPEEINILYDLLAVFSTRTICDFTFVKDFLHASVTRETRHPNRKAVLTRFLALFQDKGQSQERKVHALQYIVTPMVTGHLESRQEGRKTLDSTDGLSAVAKRSEIVLDRDYNASHSSGPSASSRSAGSQTDAVARKGPKPTSQQSQRHSQDEMLDAVLIQRIMKDILDQSDVILRDYDEPLSAELLRLATVLIRYMPKELGRYRKELIKFGWNHLKREDSIAKHWAFVNVSRFFEAYQAPVKIILQVYVALLRACQGDGKELVQQALDILTPALPLRLVHNPSDHKYPIWIRYTKKILLEEGHSVPNLVHIWQLIARHPSLFFVARAQFVPIMVNSLNRIGLNTAPPTENRRLALDLVHLILTWEKTRRANARNSTTGQRETSAVSFGSKKRSREEESKHSEADLPEIPKESSRSSGAEPPIKTRKSEDSQPIVVSSALARSAVPQAARDADEFKPSPAMIDMIINFLTQVLFRPMDHRETPILTRRCISLLREALSLWPDATVRLHFIEKVLTPLPAEKTQASTGVASAPKSVTNPFTSDFSSADAKSVAKTDIQKNDKSEQARLKRVAARHSALATSLLLAQLLAKHQGKRFVEGNINAVRALIGPSVSEGSPQAASQFASFLTEILPSCPISASTANTKECDPSPSGPIKMEVSLSRNAGTHRAPGQKQAKSGATSQANVTDNKRQEDAWIAKLIGEIGMAIEMCLKSSDATKNHSGMIVLQVFSEGVPRDFVRYQESLAKALHRMTKENLSGAQQSTPAGGSTAMQGTGNAGPQRAIGTNDRVATLNANPSTRSAGLNTNQEKGPSNDAVRNGKSSSGQKNGQQSSQEMRALVLCLSLLGENISTLEAGQRKTLFHVLWALIDRCVQVEVLLEIVRIVGKWVFWKPQRSQDGRATLKEPLSAKEKVHFLHKMIIFERISGQGSQELMNAYLTVILRIFGGEDPQDKRPELIKKLERAFMLGLKTIEAPLRTRFFQIYNASVDLSLGARLNYVVAKQDWEHLSDTFWIKHATELILSAVNKKECVRTDECKNRFALKCIEQAPPASIEDKALQSLRESIEHVPLHVIIDPLVSLLHFDSEVAHKVWVMLLPKTWEKLGSTEQMSLEKSIALLLTKEYHQVQVSWRRNNIQSLLESVGRCHPLPVLRSDVVRHLGSRWNAWHSALRYLERREADLTFRLKTEENTVDDRQQNQITADLEDIFDSQTNLFSMLQERDYVAGLWKHRAKSRKTTEALCLEQIGLYTHAQETYSEALSEQIARSGNTYALHQAGEPGRTEIAFWEERWIECARSLCQWEALTEFSRTIVSSKLLHECLWRLPDWSALKELLIKNPVEDGPQLKVYQAYVQLQENKLDVADNFITQGYLKAQEKFCSLPETSDLDASASILVQFQQLVELQESTRILSELNALSRHGNGGVNVDQKVDNIRLILNTWRERLPSPHEPLPYWNDILTWRNHVHAVVVNVLDALKEAANAKVTAAQGPNSTGGSGRNAGANAQTAQVQAAAAIAQALSQQVLVMGVNETAWNVHRFAKACRKQGYPDVALYVLQKMYPFGTMELTEYFVKTKETARSFMDGPKGLGNHVENGLHELNRCNMDHFNPRQKAQLFTVKGKLCMALGREDDAVEAFSTALHTSPDVGSAWLAWGQYCDSMQERAARSPSSFANFTEQGVKDNGTHSGPGRSSSFTAELAFREAAVNCYIQAARFGSRKTRGYFPRVLRLLSVDLQSRQSHDATGPTGTGVSSEPGQTQKSGLTNRQGGNEQEAASDANGVVPPVESSSHSLSSSPSLVPYKQGVSKIISSTVQEVPTWMWLPWIPQLVAMLAGREAIVVRPLLVRLAQQYPQALFLPLKSFMEERKLVDKPSKELHKEAMKLSRPITPALRLSASPAQLNTATRQAQVARESVQRANQRYLALRKELEILEKTITSSEGTPDHAAKLAKKAQLKNEFLSTQKILEKYIHAFQAATQRQRHIQESITGLQTSQSSRHEVGGNPVKPPSAKPGEGHERNRSESAGKNTSSSDGANRSISLASSSSGEGATISANPFQHADAVMTQLVRNHQELHYDMDMTATEICLRMQPSPEESLSALMDALLHQCYNVSVHESKDVFARLRTTLEGVWRKYFGVQSQGHRGSDDRIPSRAASLKQAFEEELAPQTARDFPTDVGGLIARLQRWQGIFQRREDSLAIHQRVEDVSTYLADLNDSEVEVFGQYVDAEFSEPSVEKHIKISRFCSEIRIVRGPTGPCREFYILGTDGKRYHFMMETGMKTGAQTAEERMSQLYRLLNSWVFGKDSEAQRRRIQLTVPVLINIGGNARLVSLDPDTSSLACVADKYLKGKLSSSDKVIDAFRKVALEAQPRYKVGERPDIMGARTEALKEICRTHVPDWCVSRLIEARMPNGTANFMFRKRLAETLGTASSVSYVLGIGAREPDKVMLSWKCGVGFHSQMRLLGKNKRVAGGSEAVPFRLTRNIEKAVGRFGVSGPFFGCIASSLNAVRGSDKLVGIWIDLMEREELNELVKARKLPLEGANEKMLEELVSKSTAGFLHRLYSSQGGDVDGGGTDSGKESVTEMSDKLIARATNVKNLVQMEASWQAWL